MKRLRSVLTIVALAAILPWWSGEGIAQSIATPERDGHLVGLVDVGGRTFYFECRVALHRRRDRDGHEGRKRCAMLD